MLHKIMLQTLFAATLILTAGNIQAQTIHAIICGGTNIPDIGSGCQASVDLIKDAFDVIEDQSTMTFKPYFLLGNNFTKSNILSTINSISPGSDDVIFFYSTSHGFNYNDNISPFTFIMAHPNSPGGNDQLDKYGLSLEKEIYNVLANKGARFTLVMAEACNNIIDVPSPARYKAMSPSVKKNIKALFLKSKGSAIVCSSKLSQYSYTDMESGGFFTNMFMESLNDAVIATEEATWKKVLDLTVKKTKGYASDLSKVQVPTYIINDTAIEYPYAPKKKEKKKPTYFRSNVTTKSKSNN